ncbi:MAG: hypothetical protein NVSMB21_22770 [Vulcanimicrobiaceae bacterium]
MRALVLVCALVALAFGLVVVPPKRTEGPPLRDFEAYYAAGETWHYRGDPYGRDVWRTEKDVPGVVATRDELLPFVGPPFGLPLWSALARLPWRAASLVWATLLGLAFATIVMGSLAFARTRVRWSDSGAALAFAATFAPLTGGIALGQVALVACAAIVAMPYLLRPRGTLGAAALALVAALQPNLAVALAARLAGARAWIAFVCAAALAAGFSALALGGPGVFARYAAVLAAQGAAERFSAIQTTPAAVAYAFGAAPDAADALGLGIALGCVAIVVGQAMRRRHAADARLWLACALAPLALPFAHEHDFAIAFAPALLVLARARGAAWVAGALASVALGVDWLGLAQRPSGLASTAALALASTCAVVALAASPFRRYHAYPGAIAAVVIGVGAVAATHPLPVWPDALPSDYHAAARATAAQVWLEEQRRSGIFARDPVLATLRAIPLAACAVIWAVASRVLATPRAELRPDAR